MKFNDALHSVYRDLRLALRGLSRRPAFTLAAVLTLALGIGGTTAIFSVVYGVLIKPLPYPESDKLVSLRHAAPGSSVPQSGISESMYVTYREENRVFEQIGLWTDHEQTLTGMGEPERIHALAVTNGILQALGVQPMLGRWFSDDDYTSGAEGPDPVILSFAFWQRRFGGDESALGQKLVLESRLSQVVGVMPARFRFLGLTPPPDVISAIQIDGRRIAIGSTSYDITLGYLNYNGLARLKKGVTLAEANADVARMLPTWLDAWPARPGMRETVADWRLAPALRPLKDDVVGGFVAPLWLLMGAVGAVLLIACANIANLLLVRADARRQEFAIRAALGAGRRRIATELMRESFVLGAVGGVVGIALAYAALKFLGALAPPNLPRVEDIEVGAPVLAFAVVTTFVSCLSFGSVAAVTQAFRTDALLGAAARSGAGRERNRMRSTLIVIQVALASVLLVGAGLMIRTFQALTAVEPGFTEPESIQVARIFIPPAAMREPERYKRAYREILERIAALPGVTAAGFGGGPNGVPLQGRMAPNAPFEVEGQPDVARELLPPRFLPVSPGYFRALGTRLVAGREATWTDADTGRKVVLISENLSRALWSEPQAAIGKRIRDAKDSSGPWFEIIGVTQDVHETLYESPPLIVFWPATGADVRAITYVIRSRGAGTESLLNEMRRAVSASDPGLPVFAARTMEDVYSDSLSRTSFMLALLAIAGALALFLSVVGIYGVMAYVLSRRTREIGIQLALGAQPSTVKRIFVLHGLALASMGVVVGLAAASALTRLMASLLFGVSALDTTTYAAVLGVLISAATLASYLPARRAATIDPIKTLRAE